MEAVNGVTPNKTVADPIAAYLSARPLWNRSRAACLGERFVKSADAVVDVSTFTNYLIPFSASMTQKQYNFYKAEAEYPGIVAQYAKIIIGGLLRKKPQLTFSDKVAKALQGEIKEWILDDFGQDGCSLSSYMDTALWEELQTSRAWLYVDYPKVPDADKLTTEDFKKYKPYPVVWEAENIINWRVHTNESGMKILDRVLIRGLEQKVGSNEFHPEYVDTVWVHEVVEKRYQVRKYQRADKSVTAPYVNGKPVSMNTADGQVFNLIETTTGFMKGGQPLDFIPAWPLNGSIEVLEPMLTPLVDKEMSLYNKLSRRNHLLYGASSYTPVISADISGEKFDAIVNAGLGSWILLPENGKSDILKAPTEALQDMQNSIASNIEEMAKMGIRMLTPETAESGVALDIRNAAQTAQLGTLNMKVSSTMSAVIAFMINWRYRLDLVSSDVEFTLSSDFNPAPLGADWLRLVTEWYQNGLIPRDIWITILKLNDIIPPDYDDEEGKTQITKDEALLNRVNGDFNNKLDTAVS